jgi:preprotein translocase subunit SecG
MTTLIIVAHIIVCLFLICIVLLQHGKGADVGASFGGSSQSLFGTEGPMPLLNKVTTLAAIVFMGTSITLAYLSSEKSTGTIMSEIKVQEQQAPAQEQKVQEQQVPEQQQTVPDQQTQTLDQQPAPIATPGPAPPAPVNDKPKGTPEKPGPQ